jgi:transaldolase
LLQELADSKDNIIRYLNPDNAKTQDIERFKINEAIFRWEMNEDQMACDKLSDGIRKFAADAIKLETMVKAKF